MSANRRHYYSWICNNEGQPVTDVAVSIYLAGTTTPAYIYTTSSGGVATNVVNQLSTDPNGYFEFWIADYTESNGYASGQKFKISWVKTGVLTANSIDYVDIFPSPYAVDETNTDTAKNKMVSNLLAKRWESKTDSVVFATETASWALSGGNYYIELVHNLANSYPSVICYDDVSTNSVAITAGIIDSNNTRVWKAGNNDAHVVFTG